MISYQDMLNTILKSSGWSQQQLAVKLGVSFPTVNYWLNNKVIPRKTMQKRIRDLYLARNISYVGPTYITLLLDTATSTINIGDEILLFRTDDSGIIGLRRTDFGATSPTSSLKNSNIIFPVASTNHQVVKGTKSAFHIYNRIHPGAYARVMFILGSSAIAVIEDFGLEI